MKIIANAYSVGRSVMAGFFTGILAAITDCVFVFFYRSGTGVSAYDYVISPLFIFVGIPILLALFGLIFFFLNRYFPKGILSYRLLFAMLTLFAIVMAVVNRGSGSLFAGFAGLLLGLELITGSMTTFLIPYLIQHPKIFMTKEGIRNSR